MNRRTFLRLGTTSLIAGALPISLRSEKNTPRNRETRLFFERADIPRIRANSKSELLGPLYREWSQNAPGALDAAFDRLAASGDLNADMRDACRALRRRAIVQIVEPDADLRDALFRSIDRLLAMPKWDFFLDGPDTVIGIQRASLAIVTLLFAREALADDWDADRDNRLLEAVAEKGCVPCSRTIYGMDHPESVVGWRLDDEHDHLFDLEMSRWPMILGGNNLRAVPAASLGLGALALRKQDPRARKWLDQAVSSSRRVLTLFKPDGSFFEGISYTNYTLRTLFSFFDAHQRTVGDMDWAREGNVDTIVAFILTMQAGRAADGWPDHVNFGDSSRTVFPGVPAWIRKQTENPLAQYAVEEASRPGNFRDFLWYEPEHPKAAPPESLQNVRNKLDHVICRTGWGADDAVLAFRSGGPAAHEHADRNHFIYKIHGERLLTDHFKPAYDWRDPRWVLRLTEAHNAVLVNGAGHQYHRGEEGTNDSLAYATIVGYEDRGDHVWWTSDATAAYRIDNYHVSKVLRTVLFAKPDIVVLLDQIRLRYEPQRVDLRFFPDNRDGAATLDTDGTASLAIERPGARLRGTVVGGNATALSLGRLDLPSEHGIFPYAAVGSEPALRHQILTVLDAAAADEAPRPPPRIEATPEGWRVRAGRLSALVFTGDFNPAVRVIQT